MGVGEIQNAKSWNYNEFFFLNWSQKSVSGGVCIVCQKWAKRCFWICSSSFRKKRIPCSIVSKNLHPAYYPSDVQLPFSSPPFPKLLQPGSSSVLYQRIIKINFLISLKPATILIRTHSALFFHTMQHKWKKVQVKYHVKSKIQIHSKADGIVPLI